MVCLCLLACLFSRKAVSFTEQSQHKARKCLLPQAISKILTRSPNLSYLAPGLCIGTPRFSFLFIMLLANLSSSPLHVLGPFCESLCLGKTIFVTTLIWLFWVFSPIILTTNKIKIKMKHCFYFAFCCIANAFLFLPEVSEDMIQ